MPEVESMALRDQIVNEIQGMDKLPSTKFVYDIEYGKELEVRFSLLVIS